MFDQHIFEAFQNLEVTSQKKTALNKKKIHIESKNIQEMKFSLNPIEGIQTADFDFDVHISKEFLGF